MIKIKRYKGFSLVEILLSMVIISTVVILMLPIISKNTNKLKNIAKDDHIVYLHNQANNDNNTFPCYTTGINSSGKTVLTSNKGKCEAHEFYIPKGIYKIDLTLVAGGGGGGGASGATIYQQPLTHSGLNKLENIPQERLSNIFVEKLVSSGGKGGEAKKGTQTGPGGGWGPGGKGPSFKPSQSDYIWKAGEGGKTGVAIINYNIPKENLKAGYKTFILNENSTYPIEQTGTVKFVSNSDPDIHQMTGGKKGIGIGVYNGGIGNTDKAAASQSYTSIVDMSTFIDKYGRYFLFAQDGANYVTGIKFDQNASVHKENWNFTKCGNVTGCDRIHLNNNKEYDHEVESSYKKHNDDTPNGTTITNDSGITQINSYYYLEGGEGAKLFPNSNLGAGGKGESVYLKCTSTPGGGYGGGWGPGGHKTSDPKNTCDPKSVDDNFKLPAVPAVEPNNRYGKVLVSISNPAGVGGGGVGGTAVKINGLAVVPGEKYTVVVGAGGSGGSKGTTGILNENGNYSVTPTKGENGTGGSSTAIYNENGELMFLVAGGAGGSGGNINSRVKTNGSPGNYHKSIETPDLPSEVRSVPFLLINDDIDVDSYEIDEKIGLGTNSTSYVGDIAPTGVDIKNIKPKYITDQTAPLFDMTMSDDNVAKTNETSRTYDGRIGSFSKYNHSAGSISDMGINNIYNGLYFRYDPTPDKELVYPGGLGGFSGLGTIAGCGGAFVGNYDGLMSASTISNRLTDSTKAGTFSINPKNNANNEMYTISTYYDNCNINTSDGQTAKFVAPSGSSIAGFNFGQAGAGGGGGGWSQSLGSGNGGAGQNGYVLINWR